MIKRTLYFGNPAYLSLNNAQLIFYGVREGYAVERKSQSS